MLVKQAAYKSYYTKQIKLLEVMLVVALGSGEG